MRPWTIVVVLIPLIGCSSPSHRESSQSFNKPMTSDSPQERATQLRDLQIKVFAEEERLYGNSKLGTLGLYGDLKSCRRKLASRQYGGVGTMQWSEILDRLTDREEDWSYDPEQVETSSVELRREVDARLRRFQFYQGVLRIRHAALEKQNADCETSLKDRVFAPGEPPEVFVEEVSKSSEDREGLLRFMCGFVRQDAALKDLMAQALGQSWLSLSDFDENRPVLALDVADSKGKVQRHVFLFEEWRLSFDKGRVTLRDILSDIKGPQLRAWAYLRKDLVLDADRCLPNPPGAWNF